MAINLFGFEIKKREEDEKPIESFTPTINDDGAVIVAAGGAYGTYIDLDGTARTESELVSKYREIALEADVDRAVDDIVNEVIDTDADEIVSLITDKLNYSDAVKNKIREEFENVLELYNFNNEAYEIFKRWYVDGRMYFHVIIDEKNPRLGIKELRYIDPRKIRKVREVRKRAKGNVAVVTKENEYFVYNDRNFLPAGGNAGLPLDTGATQGIKIAVDSIIHVTSGLMDKNNTFVYSYLQKAIRPLNQLRTLEDATVIYRISRAPERRIFYIDVGNMPKIKAEQYLREMMVKHKNRLVYDASTGEIRDDRKYMTMMEDYWLPRREGNRGTEITTLPAGQNLGQMEDVEYFQKKLFQSLNVPISRLMGSETGFNIGRAAEITRDEVKFTKFAGRLRKRFSQLFMKTLEKQLILKGIVAEEDWPEIAQSLNFDFAIDNHFEEFKDAEVLQNRLMNLNNVLPYIGRFYSDIWVRRNVLMQSDDDIEKMMEEISQENSQPNPDGEDEPSQDFGTIKPKGKTSSTVPNITGTGK